MALDEARYDAREHERYCGPRHAESDPPGDIAGLCSHRLERVERAVHPRTCGLEKALAGVGERDAARSARKQRKTDSVFELAHGLTQCGRRYPEIAGCRCEAAPACDCDEG